MSDKANCKNDSGKDFYDTLFPEDTTARTSLTRQQIEITNRRYQDDPFWTGPKGLEYGLLLGAEPYQVANLYPDAVTSYFVGWFKLPKGAKLIIKGQYGYLRYFSYTVAVNLPNGQLGEGDFLVDEEIEPNPDSVNPYTPGNDRYAKNRNYTIYIVNGEAPEKPEDRSKNTLYTGMPGYTDDEDSEYVHLALRNYLPDVGFDGTGNAPLGVRHGYGLPEVTLKMPGDDKIYHDEEMLEILQVKKNDQVPGSNVEDWINLVKESEDQINAPAFPPTQEGELFQRFWNTDYSCKGLFIRDPEERVTEYCADKEGGLANNPDTVYMMSAVSLGYEKKKIFVITGKMPRHPRTRHGERHWKEDTQLRYWSATSGGALPSGEGWATVYDEEMPLDEEGNFIIVMSWQEDRPKNARLACGVKWLDFGNGEGHFIGARNWVNYVYIRYQHMDKDWDESPLNIDRPTEDNPLPQDAETMKEYYPRAKYMSKEDFEGLCEGDGIITRKDLNI